MSKKHKPITIQRMKTDLAKFHNIVVREEKVLTHLRYNKYIGNIYVRFVGSINIADDEDAYQKSLQRIEKKLNHRLNLQNNIPRPTILDVAISGVNSQEEIDELHKNKEKSDKTLPNLKTVVKKQKVPKGSLKHRVKMHISGKREEIQNTIDQITNLFGDDKNESTYVNIPSLEWFNKYKFTYTPLAVYVNFENEDDIIMLAPFNNHSCIRSMKLDIFDGK